MAMTQFKKDVAAKLLSDPDTFAFTLMVLALDLYDDEVFTDDPAVLFYNMEQDLGGKFSEDNENKLNAAITVMTTDAALRLPDVFSAVAAAFSGNDTPVDDLDEHEIDAGQFLWAIVEIGLLNGESFDATSDKMSDAVITRINASLEDFAVDPEEEAEGDEIIDAALTEPYYRRIVTAHLLALIGQLSELGVAKHILGEMLQFYGHSMDELEDKD